MSAPQFLICVRWNERARIPCVQRSCGFCEATVAIEANNATVSRGMVPVCLDCSRELFPNLSLKSGPGLIGGVAYHDPAKALLAAKALLGAQLMTGVCKFCGCTDSKPCLFSSLLVSPEDIIDQPELTACAWLLEDVCTNPKAESLMVALALLEVA